MYYKVKSKTETFEEFDFLFKRIKKVNNIALALAKKLGFSKIATSRNLAGGINAFYSVKKPDGYRQVGKDYQCLYFPKVAHNKELLKKIEDLPIIKKSELNKIIDFKETFTGKHFISSFGIAKRNNHFLLDIDKECDFTVNKDMTEILESEYNELFTILTNS